VPISFTLRVHPFGEPGQDWAVIILRDASGRIRAGDEQPLTMPPTLSSSGGLVHTQAWAPPNSAGLRADIFYLPYGPE
jgi:hypothetical protein